MPRSVALFFSYVFHPLWMPLMVFLVAYGLDPYILFNPKMFGLVVGVLVINTVAPGISLVFMMRMGMITTAEIYDRRERLLPFVLILFYFVLAYIILRYKVGGWEPIVMSMFTALLLSVGAALVITFWWKISIHSLSQGGMVGTLVALSGVHSINLLPWIVGAVAIAAAVASSRILLKAHSSRQTYVGFALSCLIHVLCLRFGFYL